MSGKFNENKTEYYQESGAKDGTIITFEKSPKGIFYHKETPKQVKDILDRYLHSDTRLFLDEGNTATGQSWGETYDIQGTIGRSTGQMKIPLLIKTKRSIGGGSILDHCIVRIKLTGKNGTLLYKHPTYQPPEIFFKQQDKLYADVIKQKVSV